MPAKTAGNGPTRGFLGEDGGKAGSAPKTAPKPFRLAAPIPREAELQAQIVDYLRAQQARGRIVWFARCNGGAVQSVRQGRRSYTRFYALYLRHADPVHKGMADLHGMLPDGRYFALEVKRPGEKATPEQQSFLAAVRAGGGIAAVVRGFDEVASVLNNEEGGNE